MEHKAYEAVKAQHERIIAINGDGAMPRDYGQNFNAIAQLLADYEALRKERDALRAALENVREYAKTSQGEWLGVSQEHAPATVWDFKEIVEMADTALNTQHAPAPQAEWTPRLGSMVITSQTSRPISYRGLQGKVEATYEEGGILYYQVRLVTGVLCEYEAHELEG